MTRLEWGLSGLLLVAASAQRANAGVVLHQTIEQKRQGAATTTESQTISIEGNREKVENENGVVIYDLERRVAIEIDHEKKSWHEVRFSRLAGERTIPHYRKTGEQDKIAGYKCVFYAVDHAGNEDIDERACYADAVPGADVATRFNRLMLKQLARGHHGRLEMPPDGIEMISEASTNMPVLHVPANLGAEEQQKIRDYIEAHPEARGGKFVTTVRTGNIEQKPIDAKEFRPPAGYRKAPGEEKKGKQRTNNSKDADIES